jgi:hypothetical protein
MGCTSMLAQESLPPAIDEQATARQLGLSEVEMARTLRAAVCSGVVLHALIKLVCDELLFFARGDGAGEYRPGHHAGGGGVVGKSAASKQDSKLAPSLSCKFPSIALSRFPPWAIISH